MSEMEIPDGWKLKKIGDPEFIKTIKGKKPTYLSQKKEKNFFPYLDIKAFEKNIFKQFASKDDGVFCTPDDVLIVWDGSRSGLVGFNQEGLVGSTIMKLKIEKEIIPKYLYYFLKSKYKILNTNYRGGSIPHVNPEIFNNLEILFPKDKKTQQKIVAKLDNIIEKIEEKKKEISNHNNVEKIQKIMIQTKNQLYSSAIKGTLTKDWRLKNETEPSSILLKKILIERQKKWEISKIKKFKEENIIPKNSKWKEKYKHPISPIEKLPELPKTWTWITLDQITWLIRDGPHYSPEYSPEGIPFITGGNIKPTGVDFENSKRITPELHTELIKRCKPEKNDILYTKGGTTGIARVNTYDHEFSVWVHVAVLKLVDSICPFYVQHALNSPWCYLQSQHLTHGVGNKDLGLTRMIRITLPLPPLLEQKEISTILSKKLSELESINMKVLDLLKKKLNAEKHIQHITSSVLTSAFSGKLVN